MEAQLFFAGADAAAQMWQLLRSRAKGLNVLPFYPDGQLQTQANDAFKIYCDPQYRRYNEDGYLMAVAFNPDLSVKHYDVLRIISIESDGIITETEVTNNYGKGDVVFPAISCYPSFGSDSAEMVTDQSGSISLSAEEIYSTTSIGKENQDYVLTEYFDYPIFPFDTNDVDSPTSSASFSGSLESSGRGSMFSVEGAYASGMRSLKVTCFDRSEFWDVVGFLNKVKGRANPFWIKEHALFIDPVAETSGRIEVNGLDLSDWEELNYLWLEDSEGNKEVVKVTSTGTGSIGDFAILFTTPSITPVRYYPAMLVRFDSDELTENWITGTVCEFELDVKELVGGYYV